MRDEDVSAIRGRKGKEDVASVARRYGVADNTVRGIWEGFAPPTVNTITLDATKAILVDRGTEIEVPSTAKGRIRKRMEEVGHNYKSLGAEIGVTPQAISEIVNGRTTGATARYALSRALGRWPEDFWWEPTND